MRLKDAREHYYTHSGNLSSVNRQLAFAGIAIIWIFTEKSTLPVNVPELLLMPLLFFIISLCCDLLHYISLAWSWGIYHSYKEYIQKISEEKDFKAPRVINIFGVSFWILKVIFNSIGYFYLFRVFT